MKDVERRLQIVGKTAFAAILLTVASFIQAGDTTETTADDTAGIIQQRGHVEGFMRLPVADGEVDATFLSGRLGIDHGKVLILHDAEQGISSHGLVSSLRIGLADAGWSTMTVTLHYPLDPVLFLSTQATSATDSQETVAADAEQAMPADDETTEEAAKPDNLIDNNARVAAAVAYLNAQQPGPTVLIAIGEAATLTDVAASQLQTPRGLVWIAPAVNPETTPEISPVLDIDAVQVGEKNLQAIKRKKLMRQNQHPDYAQRLISNAGYNFAGFENRVLAYLRGWAHRHFVTEETN